MTPPMTREETQEEMHVASLLRVASRLIVVMEQEIATLRAMRPRDMITILQTIKAAGALQADIQVM